MLRSLFSARKAQPAYPDFALQNAERERWDVPPLAMPAAQADLYRRLAWLQIAVRIVAETCAAQALQVLKVLPDEDNETITNHPFEALLQRPNPLLSRHELLVSAFSWKRLTGNAYWWLNKPSQFAPPAEIWPIPTAQIRPVPDGKLYIAGYEYDAGLGKPIALPPDSIVHFKNWNPLSSFVGLSVVEALAIDAQADMARQQWDYNFFDKHHGKTAGAISFAQMIPDAQWAQIKDEFREQYGGTARNTLLLRGTGENAVSYIPMMVGQKDMDFFVGRNFTRDEIFQACGVPPGVLDKNATEANATAGKALLNEMTVWPELVSVAERITTALLPLYGPNLIAEFEDPRKTDRALELQEYNAFGLDRTINENRAEQGLEPLAHELADLIPVRLLQWVAPNYATMDGSEKEPEPIPAALQQFAGGDVAEDVEPEDDGQSSDNPEDSPPSQDEEGEQPAPKALLDELAAWRRKCAKRDRLADFAPDVLPDSISRAVKALGAEDWHAGFAWIGRFEALKAKRQPDRVYEERLRKQLSKLLQAQLAAAEAAIMAGEPLDYEGLATEVKRALLPTLTNAAIDEAVAQAATVGLSFDIVAINTAALEWAKAYSYELVKGISTTTQKLISQGVAAFVETPGMTVGELRSVLERGFDANRASMIATTEVTRAYSQGTQIAQAELAEAGIRMQRIWNSSGDELVCPICEPLNGKAEHEWDGNELPGHVNCRCWDTLEVAE